MKNLKKLLTLAIAVVMAFSFAACGKTEKKIVVEKTPAEKFVEENKDTIIKTAEGEDESLDCEVYAEGNSVIIEVATAEFDGLSDEEKKMLQSFYDAMKEEVRETLLGNLNLSEDIDSLTYRFTDSKGNTVAEMVFDN